MQIRFIQEGSVTYSPQGPARVTIGQIMDCEDETVANALVDLGWAVIEGQNDLDIAEATEDSDPDPTLALSETGPRSRRTRKAAQPITDEAPIAHVEPDSAA